MNALHTENDGCTALQAAASGGHLIILNILLKAGTDSNTPPAKSGGRTALQAAAGGGRHIALGMLLKAGLM